MSKIIMGVKLQERKKIAPKFQELLSQYGCEITTRLGLHVASSDSCSQDGLIILEFIQDADDTVEKFENELSELGITDVQKMVF